MIEEDLTLNLVRNISFSGHGFNPQDIDEVIVEATEGSVFSPLVNVFQVTVHTGSRDPDENIIRPGETGRAFNNTASLSRNGLNQNETTSSSTGILAYRLVEPLVGIQHGGVGNQNPTPTFLPHFTSSITADYSLFVQTTNRHFRIDVNVRDMLAGTVVETDKIVALIPNGLTFNPNSIVLNLNAGTTIGITQAELNNNVEVVDDFEGTGQTALVFHIPSFTRTVDSIGTETAPIRAFSILYGVNVDEDAPLETLESVAHLSWRNRDEVAIGILPLNSVIGSNSEALWAHRRFIVEDRFNLLESHEIDNLLSEGIGRVNVSPPLREISIIKTTPRSSHILEHGSPLTNMLGNEIPYFITVVTRAMLPNDIIETNQLVDLLPVGQEFVPGSQTIGYFQTNNTIINPPTQPRNVSSSMTDASIAPRIVHNYMGTGQTALIFPLDDIITSDALEYSTNFHRNAIQIHYRTRITSRNNGGANTNQAFLSWTNRDRINPARLVPANWHEAPFNTQGMPSLSNFVEQQNSMDIVTDIWDLNGNGDTTDTILRAPATFHYTPPFELLMFKEVRGNQDANFLINPATGISEMGEFVDFRIRLLNNSTVDIGHNNFLVIDILPYANDSLGSTFTPRLMRPITVPAGYSVSYTTSPINSPSDTVMWSSLVSDYSQVTAVRFEMNEGHILPRESEVIFEMRLSVPSDLTMTSDDVVINKYYTSLNNGDSWILSNEAHVRLFEYSVDGFVFHDLNDNGILDHGVDNVISNHLVELLRVTSTGYEVVDRMNTNAAGFYSFRTVHPDAYFIRIHAPNSLNHIEDEIGGVYGANSFIDSLSNTFTLGNGNLHQRKNAGFEGDNIPPVTGFESLNVPLGAIGVLTILVIGFIIWQKKKVND